MVEGVEVMVETDHQEGALPLATDVIDPLAGEGLHPPEVDLIPHVVDPQSDIVIRCHSCNDACAAQVVLMLCFLGV